MSDDDWETDPDFENDVTEEEQRYGAKTIGFARTDIDMKALADSTKEVPAYLPPGHLCPATPPMHPTSEMPARCRHCICYARLPPVVWCPLCYMLETVDRCGVGRDATSCVVLSHALARALLCCGPAFSCAATSTTATAVLPSGVCCRCAFFWLPLRATTMPDPARPTALCRTSSRA